jgi:LysM repeat protein
MPHSHQIQKLRAGDMARVVKRLPLYRPDRTPLPGNPQLAPGARVTVEGDAAWVGDTVWWRVREVGPGAGGGFAYAYEFHQGERYLEPLDGPPVSGPPTGGFQMYTVRPGDTLSEIAARCNTTVAELLRLNPEIQDPDLIRAYDRIRVPA